MIYIVGCIISCVINCTLKVNQNGILSFERPITGRPSLFPTDIVAIAPFWTEVNPGHSQIYYKKSSQWCLLEKVYQLLQFSFTSAWNVFPTSVFTATWIVFEPGVLNQVPFLYIKTLVFELIYKCIPHLHRNHKVD